MPCIKALLYGAFITFRNHKQNNAFISNLYYFKLSILLLFSCSYAKFLIHKLTISNIVERRMKLYADYVDSKRWISLSDATELTIKHRAAADCFAVLELLQPLKDSQ